MPTSGRADEAVREYAHLLLKMHELDPRGQNDSPELEALCARLDVPWSHMGARERQRVKGLSQDLYALGDGRRGVPMSLEEKRRWGQSGKAALLAGDPDVQLAHLRQPFPQDVPAGLIPFLQARCWERLGDLEVALVFMREAERTIPTALLASLDYLRELGRVEEAAVLADRVIAGPELMAVAGS
jgi:hypothetical protein